MSKINSRRGPGKPLEYYVETHVLLNLAKTYADFQDFKMATKYTELALKKDRLNKEVRSLLSQYSKTHAIALQKEVDSINILHKRWTERAWTDKARKQLKDMELSRLLQKYQKNVYDRDARKLLSYYDRDRWRAKFMFEVACVVRVQRFMRNKFVCWNVQQKFREKYLARASRAWSRFNSLQNRYSDELRTEIRAVVSSRFCPRKHAIRKLQKVLDAEDAAAKVMTRSSKTYLARQGMRQGIARTKARKAEHREYSALRIQVIVRRHLAVQKMQRVVKEWARKAVATLAIQRYWRWRERTFQHSVTKIVVKRRRQKMVAFATFTAVLRYHLMKKVRARRGEAIAKSTAQLEWEEKIRRERVFKARQNGAKVIQCFFLGVKASFMSRSCSKAIRARRQAGFSHSIDPIVERASSGELGYIKPGFRQSGPLFGTALSQREVYCSSSFELADAIMLASLLRHNSCKIKTLIFQDIPDGSAIGLEEHILPALYKCASIKRVCVLGGNKYPPGVFQMLFRLVQVDNPRVVHVHVEKVNYQENEEHSMKKYASRLCDHASVLLMDYFNYCLPGLTSLSLHGCYLRDEDCNILLDGLAVNSSLRRLSLSMNILTDASLVALLEAVTSNPDRPSRLEHIELGYNLVACGRQATDVIEDLTRSYVPAEEDRLLYVHLEGNPIALAHERWLADYSKKYAADASRGLRIGATTRAHTPASMDQLGDEMSVATMSSLGTKQLTYPDGTWSEYRKIGNGKS
jgi:hypothetical protein